MLGSFWEGAKEVPKIFQHNFARPIVGGTGSHSPRVLVGGRRLERSLSWGELIPSWNEDGVLTVCEPEKYANQMKLFNPITSGIFSGLTGDLMGATALVAYDVVAPEMTQSQISYCHYSH